MLQKRLGTILICGFLSLALMEAKAAVTITSATGGGAISADTAATAPSPAWTTLGPIVIAENGNADISAGTNVTLVLKAPSGFEFNTGATPSVTFTNGRNITSASAAVSDASTITITLTITNTTALDTLVIDGPGFQVRPTAGAPLATGKHIYRPSSGGGTVVINGVTTSADGSSGSNFGTLTEVIGAFTKLQLLMPGETASPGSGSGKTGTPSAQTVNTALSVTVNAVDNAWNLINTITDTVGITSSDANATFPTNAALLGGTKNFSITFKSSGNRTVTATDITNGARTPNTGSSTVVNPGVFAKLQILVPGENAAAGTASGKTGTPSTQFSGITFPVTVNAVDANWNVLGTNDTVQITSSDPFAVLPSNAALVAGTANFYMKLKTLGTATVTASNLTHTAIAGNTSPAITVSAPVLRGGPVVAIHDSELTRALETMTATNSGTPTGAGTTGFEWWPTNWHYFVMPESLKEALASDGTAYEVVSDADISAGRLMTNGQAKYPILISLACEAVRDDEIAQLTNYVAAGGTLFVGSSSFTRQTNGASRGDFAVANQLGLHCTTTNVNNWAGNTTFLKTLDHPLISHMPSGLLTWRMPSAADETPWGISPAHTLTITNLAWQFQLNGATAIAHGDGRPYLAVNAYGRGNFIYHAGMQPLIAHGGYGPGMYAYRIFRNAIEAAFAHATPSRMATPRVSPWPYAYDAALNVRHDFENYQSMISSIESSAAFEATNGIKGDYYFCTGTLRDEMANSPTVVASLRRAVTNYGATIQPHNGGLKNLNNTNLVISDYDYWHWGLDELLNNTPPPGYANGKAYAMASLSNSFNDVEGWLSGITNGIRSWVAPYFNATREDSYDIQQQLGVKITGEQKVGPFPHWTVSTLTPGKRYSFLTLPVSDWYVTSEIGQAIEAGHSSATVHALIDAYYGLGALINLYSHSSSDGGGAAGGLVQDYIRYSAIKPRLWRTNAVGVYSWWLRRNLTQIVPAFTSSNNLSTLTLAITGATDPQTAVEALLPASNYSGVQVFTNGVAAGTNSYRTNGQIVKVAVGTTITNAVIQYFLNPNSQNDGYTFTAPGTLTVPAPGVLTNDSPGMGTNLTAILVASPTHGTLNLGSDGGFNYTPATNFGGVDSFTYKANDGVSDGNVATVTIVVSPTPSVLFSDDFSRQTDPGPLAPWSVQSGNWTVTAGEFQGGSNVLHSYGYAYTPGAWTNYSVQARMQFPAGAYGGGLGGRLNPMTGAHYSAWIYPENSPGGSRILRLIKFQDWTDFSYQTVTAAPIQQVPLPSVGTNWHTLKVQYDGTQISVFYDGAEIIRTNDVEAVPYTNGGITLDMWTETNGYVMHVDDVLVTAPVIDQTITFDPPANHTYGDAPFVPAVSASSALPVTLSILSGPATMTGTNIALTGIGTVTVRASQAGDQGFKAAVAVDRSFTVGPATLTVMPDNKTNVYGTAVPALTASYTGFVNGDTSSVISGAPALSTTAATGSQVGLYPITATLGTLSTTNYTFAFAAGQVSITKAQLTVTANNASRGYQQPDPLFTASYSGFVNGDTTNVLSGSPAFTTTAVATSPAGDYSIIPSAGTLSAANYAFNFVNGVLSVLWSHPLFTDGFTRNTDPGPVTPWIIQSNNWIVTAGALQGGPNPIFNYGFIYLTNTWTNYAVEARIRFPLGAFGGGLGGRLNSTTGTHYGAWIYPEGSPGGSNVLKLIKFQNWGAFGYNGNNGAPIQQVSLPGVGTNWHTLRVTYDTNRITILYDNVQVMSVQDTEAQPYLTGGVSVDFWTDATPYVMNVDDVSVLGPPLDQTITFDALANKTYGDAPFALTASASSGLPVNFNVLSGPASLSGNMLTVTNVGTVTVVASQPGDTNYAPAASVQRSFTVNPAALTLTADSKARAYGAANPALTGTLSGVQNGDNITATYATTADTNSPVGTYAITAALVDAGNRLPNYTVVTNAGTLTIQQAVLTVRADDKSRIYGGSNPPFTASYSGFVNGETTAVLSGTPNLTTSAVSGAAVGSYTITAAQGSLSAANYSFAFSNGTLAITPASLLGTADNKSRLYGQTNPVFTVTYTGFVNSENSSIVTGALIGNTTAGTDSPVGTYPISVSGQSAPNYSISYADGLLTINPAVLLVRADDKSRAYGQTNPVFTATMTGFVNGESNNVLGGTLALSTVADTNSPIGTYPIVASGLTSTNYLITYSNGTLTVTPYALTVTAADTNRVYGAPNPTFTGNLTGVQNGDNITATYSTSATATNNIGTYTIVPALADPNGRLTNYSVTISNGTLTVTAAVLSVTASNQSRTYGAPNPTLTGSIIGTQNGDNITATYSTTATQSSPVGNYAIVPTLADPDSRLSNYTVSSTNGTLAITPASLLGTADNKSRLYGQTNPVFTVTYSGFVNSENSSIVTGTLVGSTQANTNSPAGTYPISVSGQSAPNYNITYADGVLTVNPAALVVRADDKSRAYGQTNPVFTATMTGFVNGESNNVLGGTLALSTVADTNSPIGTYPIVASGLTSTNYLITYSNGTLTVTPYALTVTATDTNRTYGAANPTLTGSIIGTQNGDNITATYSTTATQSSPVGNYAIMPTLADPGSKLTNYTVSLTNGTLAITPASLLGTADNKSRVYGQTNPVFTVTYSGFVNSENSSIVTGALVGNTTADTNSPVGTYPISVSGQSAPNYSISYADGVLTVNPAVLLVRADDKSRAYGQTNPVFTATMTGFVNGESNNVLGGTLALSTVADTNSPIGTYPIVASGLTSTNYLITYSNGTLTVTPYALTVTAADTNRVYGAPNPTFTGNLTGVQNGDNITATYSTSATATNNIGTYTIVPALADPNGRLTNYSVTISNGMLTVTAAALMVTADNTNRTYGAANPTLTGSISGTQNGDNITATYSTSATASSPVGSYSIVPALQDPDSRLSNYIVTTNNGTLTISAAALSVSADDKSRTYGASDPIFTGNLLGVQHGDHITVGYGTAATTSSPVGNYAIVPTLADPDSRLSNYMVSSTNGTLVITPASLLGTADNKSRLYGQTNPVFTVTYTGFVNSENSSIVTGALISNTTAGTNSPAGTYPISVSGQSALNYSISYADGVLTVNPAALLVQADDKSRAYGQTNPLFTATMTGFVNGESNNVLSGVLTLSTVADTNSPIGTYPIVASGLTSTNYLITYSNGTLTVTPYALTVTAADTNRVYGAPNPTFTGNLTGVQNGDNITATYSTSATATNNVGTYSIVSALADPNGRLTNYSVTISNGTLTVTAAALSVTASNQSRTYGAANPTLTGSISGTQNGDNITATYSTSATASSPVGPYSIVPTLADPDSRLSNYTVSSTNGTLAITPASLVGMADNKSRLYGQTNPVFTVTYSGFVNSENSSIVTGILISNTTAGTNSPVGTYPISVSGQSAPNYSISYVDGTLTVTAANSSLALSSSINPAVQGSNVTFTASLSAVAPGSGPPTGSVQFYTNGFASGSPVTLSGGNALTSLSTLPAGSNLVVAVYTGDGDFFSSSNAITQVITAAVSDRPATLGLTNNGDGTVTVTFQGAPGVQYVAQATDDLLSGSWLNVSTNVAPTNGLWTYTESTAGHAQRFYRSAKLAQSAARPELPTTLSITNNGNGTVTVKFRGTSGVQYVAEASDDLSHWTTVSTSIAGTDGFWTLTESVAGHPTRYYRSGLISKP